MTDGAPNSSAQMYFSSSLGVLFSRVVGIVAGVASLWFLTRILSTEDFAGYTFGMSLIFVLGYASGLGLERVMLLKIGQLAPQPGALNGSLLARRIARRVAATSVSAVVLTLILLMAVPALSANNNLLGWFVALMPIVPIVALTAVLIAWLQANHVVGRPQALHGQTDALRCLGFFGVFVSGFGAAAVALSAVAAALIPPAILARRSIAMHRPAPGDFVWRDVLDGLSFFGMRLATIGFMHADILVIGVLAPPEVVAPYVVASRFALLLEAGQQVFAPAYSPRVRRHIEEGTPTHSAREYHVARVLGFLLSSTAALGLVLIGEPLLNVFGDFGGAYGVLLMMCAGQLLLVGAGLHSVHLSMSGHLTTAMTTQLTGLAVFLALLLALVPGYGAQGAAIAFVCAQAALAANGLRALWQNSRIWPFQSVLLLTYLLAVSSLILGALLPTFRWPAGTLLLGAIVLTLWHERQLVTSVLRDGVSQVAKLKSQG